MTTGDYYRGMVEDVLEEMGVDTDDSAAMAAVEEGIAARYGSFDDLATALDSYVADEVRRRIAPIAREWGMPPSETGARVSAYVTHEAWVGDYAVPTGGGVRFDCAPALDRITDLALIESIEAGRGSDEADEVYYAAVELGLCDPYDGPFIFEVEHQDEIDAYVAARRAAFGS